jgi:GrpB-like predicted nucleotidyltransferase (UPF0157 family)
MDSKTIVTIAEPDPGWPSIFLQEREWISKAFGAYLISCHHIGSTALIGVAARPIIDVIVLVSSIESLSSMQNLWMRLKLKDFGEQSGINYRFLTRSAPYTLVHLHVYEFGDPQVRHWLELHRFLKETPAVCQLYSRLKRKIGLDSKGSFLVYEHAKRRFLQQAFHQSVLNWQKSPQTPQSLNRFMTLDQVAQRIWNNYCLYWQTLFQFSDVIEPLPYVGVQAYNAKVEKNFPSLAFRHTLEHDSFQEWLHYLLKYLRLSGKNQNIWVSPFDSPNDLSSFLNLADFVKTTTHSFLVLPAQSFEVYEEKNIQFITLHNRSDLAPWTKLLKETSSIDLYDFFSSLPSKIYAHGEPIEIILALENEIPVAASSLHYYRESAGLVELGYRSPNHLRALINFCLQKVHRLDYPYLYARAYESEVSHLEKLGFKALFPVQEWRYEPHI